MMELFNVALLLSLLAISNSSDPEVVTKQGTVRGLNEYVNGSGVNTFKGIPFAEPPVGELRFKKPQKLTQKRNSVLEATKWPNNCPQSIFMHSSHYLANQSEDCLYLNIWTPASASNSSLKPVMVFIHGGGFLFMGSSFRVFDAKVLASVGDVVVVTMNYRLGLLGFMYGNSDEIPGNMGLHDQAMALEWVNENIEYFGGDKDKVTLFGESVGSMSVSAHIIANSKHFKHAIMMSGTLVEPYFITSNEAALERDLSIAKRLGCNVSDDQTSLTESNVKCLRNITVEKLIEVQFSSASIRFLPIYGDTFLSKTPTEMWSSMTPNEGSNLLIGTVPNEGIAVHHFISHMLNSSQSWDKMLVQYMDELLPKSVSIDKNRVIEHYFNDVNRSDTMKMKAAYYEALSDLHFDCQSKYFAENYAKSNVVFQYLFAFESERMKDGFLDCDVNAPCHAQELPFTFGTVAHPDDKIVSNNWIKIISEFARTGTVSWPRWRNMRTTATTRRTKNVCSPFVYKFRGTDDKNVVDAGFKENACKIWRSAIFKS